jgi:hypothetical protein
MAGYRLEARIEIIDLKTIDDAAEKLEVHPADQLGVVLGQRVERAIGQSHVLAVPAWFISAVSQHSQYRVEGGALTWPRASVFASPPSERCAEVVGGGLERLANRGLVALCGGEGFGKKPSGELVIALREADRQLSSSTPVELRGPTRPRSPSTRRPRVVDGEKAVVNQPIEVELGDVMGNPYAGGGLFSIHRSLLGDHEAVEGAPDRVAESGDAGHLSIEPVAVWRRWGGGALHSGSIRQERSVYET